MLRSADGRCGRATVRLLAGPGSNADPRTW